MHNFNVAHHFPIFLNTGPRMSLDVSSGVIRCHQSCEQGSHSSNQAIKHSCLSDRRTHYVFLSALNSLREKLVNLPKNPNQNKKKRKKKNLYETF